MRAHGFHLLVAGDFLRTLMNCHGYYKCPRREDGTPDGPIVGYAAEYEPGFHGCRHIFAEKTAQGIVLGRYEGDIKPGDQVVIGEELVNNASTTEKLIRLVEDAGGTVIGISCAINRSYPFRDTFTSDGRAPIPIVSVIERPTPQYRQDDALIVAAVEAGNPIIWKPKYAWGQMAAAMKRNH